MQNKYFKYLLLAILVVFIVPQITLASWYNPFTWNWNIFSWFSKPQIVAPVSSVSNNQNSVTQQNTQSQNTSINSNTNTETPTITSISQASATVGDGDFGTLFLSITGNNFTEKSVVNFNNSPLKTSPATGTPITILSAILPTSSFKTPGTYTISVTNPDGKVSNTKTFTVNSTKINSVPTITSIYPSSTIVNGPDVTLIIGGTDFVRDSIVKFNGIVLPIINLSGTSDRVNKPINSTDYFSPDEIGVKILSQYLKVGGAFNIVVTNPTPGGGTSNIQKFTVSDSSPIISEIIEDPSILMVRGSGFGVNSVINFNGVAQKTSLIPFADISNVDALMVAFVESNTPTIGTYNITVTNPGGKVSNSVSFKIDPTLKTEQSWKDPSVKLEENYTGTVSNINLPNNSFNLTVGGVVHQINLKTVKEPYIIKQNSISPFTDLKMGDTVSVYGIISSGNTIDAEFINEGLQ